LVFIDSEAKSIAKLQIPESFDSKEYRIRLCVVVWILSFREIFITIRERPRRRA
jgi:hypothetical protein